MGYEIIYDRRFIKLDDKRIIPLVLIGSNNCSMFCGGREIAERSWDAFCTKTSPAVNAEEYLNTIVSRASEHPDSEWAKYRSEWLCGKDMEKFISNGIKNAITVEDIKNSGYTLSCSVWFYNYNAENRNDRYKSTKTEYIHTTEELNKWIADAEQMHEDNFPTKYYNITINSIKPLSIKTVKDKSIPVVCVKKTHGTKMYLETLTDSSMRFTADRQNAIVFDNEIDFYNKTAGHFIRGYAFRLVKAD